jgi:outer membrane lipoprotein SlyB
MNYRRTTLLAGVGVLCMVGGIADTFASVRYGQITAVSQVNIENQGARAAGALVGGLAGVASGSGQSSSNRALRGLGGAAVGRGVAGAAGNTTGFEYTILVGGTRTMRMVTEKGGLRVGDCVSVETGQFNNIRLAPDDRCALPANAAPPQAAVNASEACEQATQQLLDAVTDEEFDRAERRMRLLCG